LDISCGNICQLKIIDNGETEGMNYSGKSDSRGWHIRVNYEGRKVNGIT
jgi:hypothetical protein